jgi:cytochrome c2
MALVLCALLLLVGVSMGMFVERHDLPNRASRHLHNLALAARSQLGDDAQHIEWRTARLNQLSMHWAVIRVGARSAGGGGVAEADGHVIIASQLGRLSYLSSGNQLAPIEATVPMNLEGLRESLLIDDPLFSVGEFRTYDLLTQRIDGEHWRLFASFARFAGENCLQFVVAQTELEVSGDTLRVTAPWQDVFIARPNCIPYKDRSLRFVGSQAGGRMVLTSDRTMLIAIGDHQFDGFNDARRVSLDPDWDLGKVVELDLVTGDSRIYATGLRNPQGLTQLRDGRIVETEHGPQGGDEINVIRRGASYGWPDATYGMSYAYPQRSWPGAAGPRPHDGHDRPAMAFVPSIGISNVVQPSPGAFPPWDDDDLLVASLRANTLFHVRLEGDRAVYAEPLPFPHRRLRDIVSMTDGRIAILTDLGELIILQGGGDGLDPAPFIVRGLSDLSAPFAEEAPARDESPVERGRRVFAAMCVRCHSLDGSPSEGPALNGVLGRRIGSAPGYRYSAALSGSEQSWTPSRLERFIIDPNAEFPGAQMPSALVTWEDAPALVAYLRTQGSADHRRRQ